MLENTPKDRVGRSALVLYGTETGNAQDIAYEIGQCLERLHFTTITRELDATPLQQLLAHDLVAIAISTTGQGDFPSNSNKFWLSVRRKKLTASSLSGVNYALIGLCDSSYPKFNFTARKLHKRLQQLGATSLLAPCEADEQGEDGTEGAFLAWLPPFQQRVLTLFPLAEGLSPIAPDQRLPSRWLLVDEPSPNGLNGRTAVNGNEPSVKTSAISPEPSFRVTLEANERVTPSTHWQDVRFLRLTADHAVPYMPGDALAIRPENSSEEVDQILETLEWQNIADIPVRFHSDNVSLDSDESFDPVFAGQRDFTLRTLLAKYLDINAIPRRSFFGKIAHYTNDDMQKERALEFADPQYLDEYFDYATRPRRSILEVLQEFNSVKIPWQEAINIFPIMRPRQFSIASGGLLKNGNRCFELLVAIVRYRTVIKRIREGVCTKYLARLPPGTQLNVLLHTEGRFHNHPYDFDRPQLLIGGGTGIAPLRSILFEKSAIENQQSKSMLIFGCREAKSDYFFQDEWLKMENSGTFPLQVITAFSRDQQSKVYIQDRIREHSKLISDFLADPKSMIVLCGSSGAMPKAVRQALYEAVGQEGIAKEDQGGVDEFIAQLERSGRYKQETW